MMTAKRLYDSNIYPKSPCGVGSNYLEAMADLCNQLGYVGGKMWNTTFVDLIQKS